MVCITFSSWTKPANDGNEARAHGAKPRQWNSSERSMNRKTHDGGRLQHITLKDFSAVFLTYSRSINTPKTVEANSTALNELSRFSGPSASCQNITPADCERFLAKKTADASAWTARKYYLALGAAFERARTWGHITENPWRKVKKPKPRKRSRRTSRGSNSGRCWQRFRTGTSESLSPSQRSLDFGAVNSWQCDGIGWTSPGAVVTVTNSEHFTTKSKQGACCAVV